MSRLDLAAAAAAAAFVLAACTRPGEDRALRDEDIGYATLADVTVDVTDGLAHIRAFSDGNLELWAQSPVVDITFDVTDRPLVPLTITVGNVVADAQLTGGVAITPLGGPRPTVRTWRIELPQGRTVIRVAPLDVLDGGQWTFAVMGDIQDALPTVHEVFARINAARVRFVISTGDIVHRGREDEWVLFEQQLATLDVPFYSTIGNHELWGDIDRWYRRFGRATVHFDYRGVAFSLVDSASAGIDPAVDALLDRWLAQHADDVHVFGTHYPPLDPVGVRMGSFASRREAEALLSRLAAANVDMTFYGHIHTYVGFENAGIPAYVSGGGGAEPMRLDGIDRHFLTVVVDGTLDATNVQVVRVD